MRGPGAAASGWDPSAPDARFIEACAPDPLTPALSRERERGSASAQDFIASSEPMPLGVFMVTQEPFGTAFQALP